MLIDVYSSAGSKVKSLELPATLFGEEVNWGLMHQAVVRQQNNRRQGSSAHVKTRGEVAGSTKKLFSQKHTGNARRGPIRSPLMRGGGKAFGPRNDRNFERDMPKKMRHAALRSCLSAIASKGAVIGLDGYPDDVKTKTMSALLKKLPVELGRNVLIVTNGASKSVALSSRNIKNVTTVSAGYLNPESVLNARHVIFMVDAIDKANELFGKKETSAKISKKAMATKNERIEKSEKIQKNEKKSAPRKKAASKKSL